MKGSMDLRKEKMYWWYVLMCRRRDLVRLIETDASKNELKNAVQGIRDAECMSDLLIIEEHERQEHEN